MNKKINISIFNQNYIYSIIKKYPKIASGRKSYEMQYKRVLKNILLSKFYKISKNYDSFTSSNVNLKFTKKNITLTFKK